MRFLFLREGEAVDGFAFQGFVRVQVLAGSFDVAMAHQPLDGDDVAPAFEQSRCVGVAEFVQSRVRDLEFEFDVLAFDSYGVVGDVSWCRCAEDAAGSDVEDGTVPGARHFCSHNHAFGEWSASMGASVVNRVVSSLDVEERDASRSNVHRLNLARSDVARFGDFQPRSHGSPPGAIILPFYCEQVLYTWCDRHVVRRYAAHILKVGARKGKGGAPFDVSRAIRLPLRSRRPSRATVRGRSVTIQL
jgi:hypothetical protein